MKMLPGLAALAATIMLGAIGAACGGGDGDGNGGGTLQGYFEELADVKSDFNERGDALEPAFQEKLDGVETVDEALDVFADFIGEALDLIEENRGDLDRIDAPAEVEDLHRELVASFNVAVGAMEELESSIDDREAGTDFEDVVSEFGTEFSALGTQLEVACFQLQDVADDNDIDVDLECGSDE